MWVQCNPYLLNLILTSKAAKLDVDSYCFFKHRILSWAPLKQDHLRMNVAPDQTIILGIYVIVILENQGV